MTNLFSTVFQMFLEYHWTFQSKLCAYINKFIFLELDSSWYQFLILKLYMTFKLVQVYNAVTLWSRLNGIINHEVSLLFSSFIVYVLNILYFNLRFYRVGITIHSASFLGLSLIIHTCAYCMKLKFILMSVFPLIFLFIFPFLLKLQLFWGSLVYIFFQLHLK